MSIMIRHTIIEPNAEFASAENSLIIMPNETAAGLEDYHVARAHDVANVTGLPVLAYERPMSASRAIFDLTLRHYYARRAADVQDSTAHDLAWIVDQEGPDKLYIAGHSAGATEGVGIIASERLAITHGVFTDPPAMKRHFPLYAEVVEYGGYQIFTERRKPKAAHADTSSNTPPETPMSAHDNVIRTLKDLAIHSSYHRSDAAYRNFERIARTMPGVGIDLIFPELTFTASPPHLREMANWLNTFRHNFKVEVLEGQYHSRFNDYGLFGKTVRDCIAKANT